MKQQFPVHLPCASPHSQLVAAGTSKNTSKHTKAAAAKTDTAFLMALRLLLKY
jgi:hypothetical protein